MSHQYTAIAEEKMSVSGAFTLPERILLPLIGMASFVRLRHAPAGPGDPTGAEGQPATVRNESGG